jgi:hypothetical protein
MKTFILAALAALTFAVSGIAGAAGYSWDHNSTFPEGSIQVSPE